MLTDKCNKIRRLLDMCYAVNQEYDWLTDAYVSDFYVTRHWQRLPEKWREVLKDLNEANVAQIIDPNMSITEVGLLPLSLLALRETIKQLTISRKQVAPPEVKMPNEEMFRNRNFCKSYWKRIKLKKRHEIELMAKVCYNLSVQTNCFYIVDVGSGLGHLSRLLSHGYGLKVCSLESQDDLSTQASKLDREAENLVIKYCKGVSVDYIQPKHIYFKVDTESNGEDILKVVQTAFGAKNNLEFGIVGLHPCGDLGATLLRLFNDFPQVKFVNIVGCCYMKLSSSSGFPLSKYCVDMDYKLSYSSRETACHALEIYSQKLVSCNSNYLKVHAYRAGLEKLIVRHWPEKSHSQVCSVKYTDDLSFFEYCTRAVRKLDVRFSNEDFEWNEIIRDLGCWRHVVIFYSMRLMLAPLVETIILLDRLLFIVNEGYDCDVTSLFDPQVSPRNQVFSAFKK